MQKVSARIFTAKKVYDSQKVNKNQNHGPKRQHTRSTTANAKAGQAQKKDTRGLLVNRQWNRSPW